MNLCQRFGACFVAAALALGLTACGKQNSADNQAGELVQSTDEFQSRAGTPIDPEHHPGKDLFENNCQCATTAPCPRRPTRCGWK